MGLTLRNPGNSEWHMERPYRKGEKNDWISNDQAEVDRVVGFVTGAKHIPRGSV